MPRPQIRCKIEKVGPAMAQALLKKNEHNRPLRKSVVARYATAMANDEWLLNGEAVVVGHDGSLLDGQHRLLAVIEADTEVEMLIVRGVQASTFHTFDSGTKRGVSDALSIRGEVNTHILARTLVIGCRAEHGTLHSTTLPPSVTECLNFLDRYPQATDSAKLLTQLNPWPRGSKAGTLAGLHLLFSLSKYGPEIAEMFISDLRNGESMGKGDPVYTLRTRIELSQLKVNQLMKPIDYMAIVIKAWNAFVKDERIFTLKYIESEAFPDIEGLDWPISHQIQRKKKTRKNKKAS